MKTETKRRITRLILAAFLPAPLTMLMVSAAFLFMGKSTTSYFNSLIILFMVGYAAIGLKSIIYSLLLEFLLNPYIKNHKLAIALNVVLGVLTSTLFTVMGTMIAIIMGAITGFIIGAVTRWLYVKELKVL